MPAKLRLHPDALRVESFAATSNAAPERGTVHAHVTFTRAGNPTCYPIYTCPECATPPVV
ncbi:hypothetical protein [Longimicrobium sp.]|uniref:hypothetical protein n=1 Tax=Longimicrobium sp. TaxID=2029185 RepID=UPI002C54EE1A|nr:hypothetical protein [Longimicrobium sp.]HSU16773.1 hypothetical protein [Longimicrobium sp.]